MLGEEGGSHDPSQTPCPSRTDGSLLWPQGLMADIFHSHAFGGSSEPPARCLKGGAPEALELVWPDTHPPSPRTQKKSIPSLDPGI